MPAVEWMKKPSLDRTRRLLYNASNGWSCERLIPMRHIPFLFALLCCPITSCINGGGSAAFAPFDNEMLYGNLESQKWYAEVDTETVCRKRETNGVFRFEVEKNGKESWHPLLISRTHTFKEGEIYIFSIKAKADQSAEINVGVTRDEKDYGNLGFSGKMALTTEWKTFRFTFAPKETSQKGRLDIGGFHEGVVYDFCEATLKPGGNGVE